MVPQNMSSLWPRNQSSYFFLIKVCISKSYHLSFLFILGEDFLLYLRRNIFKYLWYLVVDVR